MEDAGLEGRRCEICEAVEVRWLHKMVHDERPGFLSVGLDRAQDLGRDFERARRRKNAFSLEMKVRNHWPDQVWELSQDRDYFTNARGYNFATFEAGGGYLGPRIRIEDSIDDKCKIDGKTMFASVEDAMAAGPDALFYARSRLTDGKVFDNWRSLCGPVPLNA